MTTTPREPGVTTPVAGPGDPPRTNRRAVAAGAVGSLVENYDFAVYGYLTPVFAGLFFATGDGASALLAALATFASAYLLRPVGGLVFGHIGDRMGRRASLTIVLLGMAVATFAIGVLPTYAAIGVGATALLVLARVAQGLAAGGEIPGAAAYVAESSPAGRRGFNCSLMQLAVVAGTLLGSAEVALLTRVLDTEAMREWGWRIPFLIALPLGVVGLYIRLRLEDTAEFRSLRETRQVARVPVLELFRTRSRLLVHGFTVAVAYFAGYYVVYIYLPVWLQATVRVAPGVASLSTTLTLLSALVVIPVAGLLSDRYSRRALLFAGAGGMAVLALPAFALLQTGSTAAVIAGQLLLGLPVATLIGISLVVLTELFSADVRCTGSGVAINVAAVTFGGAAPLVCAWLVQVTGVVIAPAFYLVVAAVPTLIAVWRWAGAPGVAAAD